MSRTTGWARAWLRVTCCNRGSSLTLSRAPGRIQRDLSPSVSVSQPRLLCYEFTALALSKQSKCDKVFWRNFQKFLDQIAKRHLPCGLVCGRFTTLILGSSESDSGRFGAHPNGPGKSNYSSSVLNSIGCERIPALSYRNILSSCWAFLRIRINSYLKTL